MDWHECCSNFYLIFSVTQIIPFVFAILIPAALLAWMTRRGGVGRVLDFPNERSLHEKPVPRLGGIAIVFGVSVGWIMLEPDGLWGVLVPFLLLAIISFIDDVLSMAVLPRLLAHFLIAAGYAISLVYDVVPIMFVVLVIVGLVWAINLFNFMDGADGLAGGMAFWGFLFLGMRAYLAGSVDYAMLNWIVSGVAFIFLLFNFHPARIFMGDVGAIPLGFLAAASSATGYLNGLWPIWFPALVFSPFWVDATVTLVKRSIRGEKVWHAHREHYYQRLILCGNSHWRVALLEYALMAVVGLTALWAIYLPPMMQVGFMLSWGGCYVMLMRLVDRRWKAYQEHN